MSRPLINDLTGLSWDRCITLPSGMETLCITDPSRLRVPFAGKGQRIVTNWPHIPSQLPEEPLSEEVTLDVSSVTNKTIKQDTKKKDGVSVQFEVQAWTFSLAYAVFGTALALCNLFFVQSSARMCCATLSPLPVVALLLQAAVSQSPYISAALVICALSLPGVCMLWSFPLSAVYIIVVALSVLSASHHRSVIAYIGCAGAVLSLGQTVWVQDPQWGGSVSLFFLVLLCVFSCGRLNVKIWI